VSEIISLDDGVVTLVEDREWPVTVWQLRPVRGADESEAWDRAEAAYDDVEDEAKAWSDEMFKDMAIKVTPPDLSPFRHVRWSVLKGGEHVPAGVMIVRPDRSGLEVGAFNGFDDAAAYWAGRFEQIGTDFLVDINHAAGRAEMFSPPITVPAESVDDALDRAKYEYAKEHYADTGRSLY
jgi:hypothetical protein